MIRFPWIALVSLYLLLSPLLSHATPVDLPVIKLDAIGQLGFAGDYAGISPFRDTRQFESVSDPSSSSVVLQNNHTFQLIANNNNGDILATCAHNNNVYFGGSFTTFNNTAAINNIVRYDVTSDTFYPLGQGLDGPVQSLMCDNDTVYVGGDFTAPIGTTNATLFGSGHVAFWFPGNNSWGPVPWNGFNGPVYTITRNNARNTILFGGRFEATGDGVYYNANSSQAVNLASPTTTVTAGNSALSGNYSNPKNIICGSSNETQGEPWLLQDGVPGYWDASFGYSVKPTMFRISNANLEGRGTRSFSIIALGSNEYFELSYVDPITHETTTCTTDCTLSNDTTVGYQDFTVLNSPSATGIRIQIDSWYGQGGGLGGVEIFQSDIAVHPQAGNNGNSSNSCASSTPSSSTTTTTGDWQSQFVYGIYQDFLTASIPASELKTTNTSVTYAPNIPVQGQYAVYATTPGCVGSSSCDQRTQVDLTLQFAPAMTTTVTIDQTSYDDKTTMIYNGFIAAATDAFHPTITLKPSANATASGSSVSLVADTFQFVRNGTNATLVSILEYSPQNYSQHITPAWHPLTEQLARGSTVRSIDTSDGNTLYIGGQFSSPNGTYRSIVSYDYTSGRMVPLNDVGVNGSVYAVANVNSSLIIGGVFNGTAAANAGGTQLNNLARYDLTTRQWSAMGMGVDGPVTHLLYDSNATVVVSGNFTHLVGQPTTPHLGNVVWSISEQRWIEPSSLVVGSIIGNETINATTSILAGRILGAQTYRADDVSLLDTNNLWTPYLLNDSAGVINTGVFWHNVTADGQNKTVAIVGGRFNLTNGIRNLALYQDGTWHGLGGSQLDGQVLSLVQLKDKLYIGGHFTGTLGEEGNNQVTSFAIYDLKARKRIDVGGVHAADGSPGVVNAVRLQPDGTSIYVGGNFSNVGSLGCPSVCRLDVEKTQWNTIAMGIGGSVYDLAVTNEQVIAAGDLTVDHTPTAVATMQMQGTSWSAMAQQDTTTSIGTVRAVLSGPNKEAIVAGRNETASFLGTWDGQTYSNIDAHLGPSSDIRQLVFMPIDSSPSESRYPADSEYMLLASGHLDLDTFGNVSAALYDGSQWFPLALSTKMDGTPGQLQEVFRETMCCTAINVIHHLPVPAVILISIAISLGLIFVLVGAGLLALFAKRKYSEPDVPEPMPPYLPGQNNRPSSLVAMLDSAQAKTLGAGAAAAIAGAAAAGAGAAAAAGPSNEKHLQQDHPTSAAAGGATSAFAALMASAAASNPNGPPSDDNPRLYHAKYPFEAKEYGELGFDANEPIVVTDASDNVWWMGYKDDGTGQPVSGLFPSNYVNDSKS